MSGNSFGSFFRVSTFGESHGPALGCVIDGCPPGLPLSEADLQFDLDRRKPGTSKYATQRREGDSVQILSGVFEGVTTGTSIGLLIENEDQRSKDYSEIKDVFRPAHADYTYQARQALCQREAKMPQVPLRKSTSRFTTHQRRQLPKNEIDWDDKFFFCPDPNCIAPMER